MNGKPILGFYVPAKNIVIRLNLLDIVLKRIYVIPVV